MNKYKNYQKFLLLFGGICIFYWFFLLVLYGNITFSLIFLLIGCGLCAYVVIERYWHICIWRKLPKYSQNLIKIGFIIGSLTFCGIEARILYDALIPSASSGDSILVLGAGLNGDKISTSLQFRLDEAIAVHKKNPDQMIIVSGGQGIDEATSEAFAMKQYLLQSGIQESLILMEDQSTNTSENFRFTKRLLEQYNISSNITLVTNGFHMHRATYIGETEGFQISRAPAKGLWTTNPCFYFREFFGVVRAYLFNF